MKKMTLTMRNACIAVVVMLVAACADDDFRIEVQEPDQDLSIDADGVNNVTLNFENPNNPAITLVWGGTPTGSGTYEVELSLSNDFGTTTSLGTTTELFLTISTQELNLALNEVGAAPFVENDAFLRVKEGEVISDLRAIQVTPYAVTPPSFSGPTSGSEFALDVEMASEEVTIVIWEDFDRTDTGVDVNYLLEAVISGGDFSVANVAASITNANEVSFTHKELNDIAITAGVGIEEQGTIDLRLTSQIFTETDTLTRISAIISLSVTTYNAEAFPIFLVGDATAAGWNNAADPVTNHHPLFPSLDNPNQYSYTGYFAAGNFKVLQNLGSWGTHWGGADNTLSFRPTEADPDPPAIPVSTEGYYTLSADIGALTYSLVSFDESGATDYTSVGIGITGAAAGGWDEFPTRYSMTQSSFDIHIWSATGVVFTDDEFKFKQDSPGWGFQWGAIGSGSNSWPYDQANGGDNLRATAGTYTVFFNDLTGDYWMIEE